jgi:UPF0271 protein
MGEGMPNDALIMPFISSANIACGFHAGNKMIMQQTIELALQYNVAIGAHPSFPDKENFGRTNMHFSGEQICAMVKEQVESLAGIAEKNNCNLHHVKPHGALYNMAAKDEALSTAICKAIKEIDGSLLVYALSGSKLINVAGAMGLQTYNEVFADRTYQPDGSLTPRSQSNALLLSEEAVAQQVQQILQHKSVTASNGEIISLKADTICIHGDGDYAVAFAKTIHNLTRT